MTAKTAPSDPHACARLLALLVPALLLGGAFGSQYLGGLYPCEMCHWQRWPHEVAIALLIVAFLIRPAAQGPLIVLAALAILASGAIGVFHAGVEYGWWEGLTRCSSASTSSLQDIMATPLIRCDSPQWTLGGVSLAGFNAFFSIVGGLAILALLRRA
ncbi:MAG: disulfide bond formation protein B [Sphingomonadaceae bacterium]|nr:disulfide bond formation protein B [Sphingomonadaceae bacterium]